MTKTRWLTRTAMLLCGLGVAFAAPAAEYLESCYERQHLPAPEDNIKGALYILVDQTMPLPDPMRANIKRLTNGWPRPGERVKIARFSANARGQFTELLFDAVLDSTPGEAYLYHLRDEDKAGLLACLATREREIRDSYQGAVAKALSMSNAQLPRTEIFHSLKRLAETVLVNDGLADKTVLIVSDGMENSEVGNFYRRKTVGKIDAEKILAKLAQQRLIPDWHQARIYMYGLGHIRDESIHVQAGQLLPLKRLWESYFTQGNGVVMDLGTPAVLSSRLR